MPEAELLRIHRGETPTKEEIEASNRHDKLLQQEYAAKIYTKKEGTHYER